MSQLTAQQVRNRRDRPKLAGIWSFIWRGAIGGIIAPLAFILFSAYRRPNDALALIYLPLILPLTGLVGVMIGLIIGHLQKVAGMRIGTFKRLLIGSGFAMCLWILYRYARGDEGRQYTLLEYAFETVLFGSVLGVLPSLMARAPKK